MRIAAIDIGTNSVHMIVVRVRPDLSFEVIDREKAMVRLGAGGLDGKALTTEAMTAALQALSKFKRLAESHTVDVILAAATSATREARNGGEFLARIEAETGIRPRVITGAEEARLIHLAAVYEVDVGSARAVVIDIGGGSTEITLGTAASTLAAKSFKIGVIRLTERFVKSDPLSGRDEQKLTKHVLSEIDRHCEQITATGFDRVIGTSGTILSLGSVATAMGEGTVPGELRNLRVSAKHIRRLRKEVVALSLAQRLTLPGLDPRRADLVVAGAVLLDAILRRLGAEDITLCDLALREGLVLDYIRRNSKHIKHIDASPTSGAAAPSNLLSAATIYAEHAQQVVRLALAIFDQTRDHPWLDRSRTGMARVCCAAARHRHTHQLRAASSAFVLSHPQWRPPRLRSGRDRSRGAGRQVSPSRPPEALSRRVRHDFRRRCVALSARSPRFCASPRASIAAIPRPSPGSIFATVVTTRCCRSVRLGMLSSRCGQPTVTCNPSSGCLESQFGSKRHRLPPLNSERPRPNRNRKRRPHGLVPAPDRPVHVRRRAQNQTSEAVTRI